MKTTLTAAGAVFAAAALLGCGLGRPTAQPAGTPPAPKATTADSVPSPTQRTHQDVRFTLTRRGLPGVDPSNMKVSCAAIDYAVILKDATAPMHWKIRKDSRLRNVTTSPAEGDLSPGGQTVIHVNGNYDGRPGDELIVHVWSEDSTQSSGIQMYCR